MKFLPLIWAGIWRKTGRAILTLLSILNAFLLFGMLQGFNSGLNNAVSETHGDILYSFSKVSQIEPLPMGHMGVMKTVPGVQVVTPLIIFQSFYRNTTLPIQAFAVQPDDFVRANPGLKVPPAMLEKLKRTRTGALVGAQMAQRFGWRVGQRVPLISRFWANRDGAPTWPVDIVGIYDGKDSSFSGAMFVNYEYVDEGRSTANGTAGFYILKIADPRKADQIAAAVDKLFANSAHETKTASERQLVQDQIKQIGDIGFVVSAIVGAVLFALLFSVGAVMMQSMRERTPELAVLKTLGFSDGRILWLILSESVVFCVFSAGLGLGAAWALFPLIKSQVGFTIEPGPVMLLGLGFAVGLAILAGLPPAIRGMRLQIVDALAGR
jgi:putative ABC transport system permease protein